MTPGELTSVEYLAGLAWLGVTFGSVAGATASVVRGRLHDLPPSARLAGALIIGYALLVLVHVLPAALGILSRPAVAVAALSSLGIALASNPRRERGRRPDLSVLRSEAPISLGVAALALVAFAAWLLAAWSGRLPNPVATTDVAGHDLPIIARWIQSGSIWEIHEFAPFATHGSYPHSGDIAILSLVLPWGSDFAARSLGLVGLPMVVAAAYALGRELRAPVATATTFAVAAVSIPILGRSTADLAMPDVMLFPAFLGGCLFLLRNARTGSRRDLVMAGLGLGMAFGTKWYGVSCVVVIAAIWLAISAATRARRSVVVRDGLILTAAIAGAGGIWLLRNWIAYGNPVFPLDVSPLGIDIFPSATDVLREQAGDSLAGRTTAGKLSSLVASAVLDAVGLVGALLTLSAAAIVAAAISARARIALGAPVILVAATSLVLLFLWTITPYTAGPPESTTLAIVNSRYALPGLMLAACATAGAVARAGALRPAAELVALGMAILGIANSADVAGGRLVVAALAAGATIAAGALLVSRGTRPPRLAIAGVVAVFLASAVVAGARIQSSFADNRVQQDTALTALIERSTGDPQKVGLAGIWTAEFPTPVLASTGPELDNHVEFIGPVENGYQSVYETRKEFDRAVAEGGYDLILASRDHPFADASAGWIDDLGLEELASNDRFVLYAGPGG